MLPEQEQKMYDAAVKKLKEQFRPVDIAELKGFEFHHRMQLPEEPVEQLGIALQNLVRKAFPQAKGREFDRLLKGRFFQALRTKWQLPDLSPNPLLQTIPQPGKSRGEITGLQQGSQEIIGSPRHLRRPQLRVPHSCPVIDRGGTSATAVVKWGTLRGSVRLLPPNLRPWFKLKLLCRYAPTITKQWNSINLIILYNE